MPRFHFNIRRDGKLIVDEEGLDCADVAAAKIEAFASAREMAIEALKQGRVVDGDSIEVIDAEGKASFTLPVRAVVD